jgi:hypothetical protein
MPCSDVESVHGRSVVKGPSSGSWFVGKLSAETGKIGITSEKIRVSMKVLSIFDIIR